MLGPAADGEQRQGERGEQETRGRLHGFLLRF
jgi:hypothetical protein